MRREDFTTADTGRLIKPLTGDYWAFVPNPLPPNIVLTWELVRQLSEAERALSELSGVARTLPNPHLLIEPFARQEAIYSSRIEGTVASLSELFLYEAAPTETNETSPRKLADVQEVANYVEAMNEGLKRLPDNPVSLHLIRSLHAILMQGVRGQDKSSGQFRTKQVWIGRRQSSLDDATYVPPPPAQMHDALFELERYINSEDSLPLLIRLALVHYQFEAIHPFLDGNGRIGRLLITLLLCQAHCLDSPLLYLSGYFDRNRDDYLDHLLAVSLHGQWEEWIRFFLRGVAEQSRDAITRTHKLQDLQKHYQEMLRQGRASTLAAKLVDYLFEYPAISVMRVSQHFGRSHHAIQSNVEKLVELGILRELTQRRRNRVYIAPEIVRVIEEPN